MEHKLILGGAHYLPLARSEIKRLRASGQQYATKRLVFPDATVTVRIEPNGHDHIHIDGGSFMYSVGVDANRIVVRSSPLDSAGSWKLHSQHEDAYSDPVDGVSTVRINSDRYMSVPLRTEDLPGSTGSDPNYFFIDSFGKGRKLQDGPESVAGGDPPVNSGIKRIAVTDGVRDGFLLVSVNTNDPTYGGGSYQSQIWRCDAFEFKTQTITTKPTMWAFTYDATSHGNRGLKTLPTERVIYVGGGKFVYGLGGSSEFSGARDADHKMVIIVTDNFETFDAYDVEAGLAGVYGSDDFALGSCCYIGNGRVMFGGYGTTDMIVFDSSDGSMVRRSTDSVSPPWLTSRMIPDSIGDDSACYWEYIPGTYGVSFNADMVFVYTTDQGLTWNRPTMSFVDQAGDPVAIDLLFGLVSVRRPLVKDGATITSNGVLSSVFSVIGEGHYEFRTSDLGQTWVKRGRISTDTASLTTGLIYRHVLYGDKSLSLSWG